MINPVGWLPYGSSDPSVLFYDPLTSEVKTVSAGGRIPASTRLISAGGGGTVADIVHHPVFGMKAYNDGTKWASYRFQTFSDVGEARWADFANAGQITFEIETDFLSKPDANSESTGAIPAAIQTILSMSAGGGIYRFLQKDATGTLTHNNFGATTFSNWYTGLSSTLTMSSWGRGQFTKVNIGWSGGKVGGTGYIAFDDQLLATFARNRSDTSTPTDFFLPSAAGGQTTIVNNHYIRKLQFSTQPPMFAVHPALNNIVIWGDSQVKDVADGSGTGMDYTAGPAFSSTVGLELGRALNAKGLFANIRTRGYSGYSIANDGVHTSLSTTASVVKALNPSIVILEAGTNDVIGVGGAVYSAFETDFRALVVDMLNHPSVKYLLLRTVPSTIGNATVYSAGFQANRATINAIVSGMPAYIDATYPQHYGKVFVADSYNALGAENPPAGTWYGQLPGGKLSGVPNNLHYAARGCQVEGATLAAKLMEIVGR